MEATAPAPLPITFGPVRSRRLGWSLGINNVPPKRCSYSCVYCQIGPTDQATLRRVGFIAPDEIARAAAARAEECRRAGVAIDCVTFVPDGEPTLDLALGDAIGRLRDAGLRVAVITNGSLLWDEAVRSELLPADLVSVKVDTVDEPTWRRLNRPLARLTLPNVLDGIRQLAESYRGHLLTETMLVEGVNDDLAAAARTARFVGALEPSRAYVTVPTRPPAEAWACPPRRDVALRVADALRAADVPTTCLLDDGDQPFAPGSDARRDLLGIIAVHPMTESDARAYLERSGADWSIVDALLDEGRAERLDYRGSRFLRATRPGPAADRASRPRDRSGGEIQVAGSRPGLAATASRRSAMETLPAVTHEHRDRLMTIVDQLNAMADCASVDCLDTRRLVEARPAIEQVHRDLITLLIPHMEAVEAAVYPALERLLPERRATLPMRAEHAEIRHLTATIGRFVEHPEGHVDRGVVLLMRRCLLRLYAILKAHLAEEQLYEPILEDRLTAEEAADLAHALDHLATGTL